MPVKQQAGYWTKQKSRMGDSTWLTRAGGLLTEAEERCTEWADLENTVAEQRKEPLGEIQRTSTRNTERRNQHKLKETGFTKYKVVSMSGF